jgi:hypothetical protein
MISPRERRRRERVKLRQGMRHKSKLKLGPVKSLPVRYGFNILIALSQLGSALTGGDPDETISSRLGKLKRSRGGIIPWTRPVSRLLDRILEFIDPNHTLDAIEDDEGL